MTERTLYLGGVERVSITDRLGRIAQLRPLSEAAPNLLSWHRTFTPEDAQQEFPNRGFVTWFDSPEAASEGTVWQFQLAEQRRFNPDNPHHNAFRAAATPSPPVAILDLRDSGGENGCRLKATEEGLDLSFVPSTRTYLWIDDDSRIGPVYLRLEKQTH